MVNLEVIGKILDCGPGRSPAAMMMMFAPLWQNTRMLVAGVSMDKTLTVHAIAETPSNEAGKKVAKNLQAVATLGENYLDGFAKMIDQEQGPAAERAAVGQIHAIGKELFEHLEIKEQGNFVDMQTQSEKFGPKTVATMVLPAILKMRQEAERAVSTNNLKQIALAMHNYHATYGHFPAAVVMGPDGKTPHSWRVEILPYLEQNQLFKAYKMDEPWDSPNNKKVLEKMPNVFNADPNQPSTMSSYYVLSGKETAFPGEQGIRYHAYHRRHLQHHHGRGGQSETSRGPSPKIWPTTPKKPLPKFGGYFPEGFNAALCDGSVHFLNNTVAEQSVASADHRQWRRSDSEFLRTRGL